MKQQWNKPFHHPTNCDMAEGAADAAVQNIRSQQERKQKSFHSQKYRDEVLRGKEKRHLTEKFQKLSANTSSLEEKGEVFLWICTLPKIPRRDRGTDNAVNKRKNEQKRETEMSCRKACKKRLKRSIS